MLGAERGTRGTVANQHQLGGRTLGLQRLEAAQQQGQVLLRRQPADVDHREVIRTQPPRCAQRVGAEARMEAHRVDRAAEAAGVAEALRGELLGELARRHQRRVGAVVEATQPGEHPRREEARAVAADVVVEARVETGGDGDAEALGRTQRGPAERAFGGDVDRVRPLPHPARGESAPRRQAEAHARVARYRCAFHAQQFHRLVGVLAGARRPYQADVVAQRLEAVVQRLHGQGDAGG